jgi:hypothetical protein
MRVLLAAWRVTHVWTSVATGINKRKLQWVLMLLSKLSNTLLLCLGVCLQDVEFLTELPFTVQVEG